jgi:signal peptidase I
VLRLRKRTLTLLVVLALVIVGAGAATIYRIFFMKFVFVPSGAMMNTIIPGDHLLVHKSFGQIERGRIVVFQFPNDAMYYVKRIIGLPGETIQVRGRTVYINGRALEEQTVMVKEGLQYDPLEEMSSSGNGPYRVFYTERSAEENTQSVDEDTLGTLTPFRIPQNSFFVMGDNRDNSEDSRYRGVVPRELIWGEASMIYYSETMPAREIRQERIFKRLH